MLVAPPSCPIAPSPLDAQQVLDVPVAQLLARHDAVCETGNERCGSDIAARQQQQSQQHLQLHVARALECLAPTSGGGPPAAAARAAVMAAATNQEAVVAVDDHSAAAKGQDAEVAARAASRATAAGLSPEAAAAAADAGRRARVDLPCC